MQILSTAFVCFGLIGLICALSPVFKIINMYGRQQQGWLVLSSLILLFILSFIGYIWVLLNKSVETVDIIIAIVFCGGGCFVYIVSNMSYQTIGQLKDIAEQKHYLAYHDSLTNMPNRLSFYEQFDQLIDTTKTEFTCLLMDVDNFKTINDHYGHDHGDMVLKALAIRLPDALPNGAIAARIGGDEFSILLPNTNIQTTIEICQQIQTLLARPFTCGRFHGPIEVSVGITMFPKHGTNKKSLLIGADIAMYQAKRSAISYQVYHSDMECPNTTNHNI